MEPKNTITTLTELEERLATAGGPELRKQLIAQLRVTELRLTARLAAMVPKAEFDLIDSSLVAARAAQRVLNDWVPGTAR
jgi:hypothetical protein